MTTINISKKYNNNKGALKRRADFLKKIFGKSPRNIVITVVPDIQTLEKKIGRRSPRWEVAVTKKNNIFILDPATAHNKHITGRNFQTILIHEMAHVFYNALIPEGVPYWLNEGLAYNLTKQKFKKYSYPAVAKRALQYYSNFHPNIYRYGPALCNIIIKKKSLKTLIETLNIFSKNSHHPKNFQKVFRDLF